MRSWSSRWLLLVGGVVVALLIASTVVVLVNPRNAGEALPEDTPEGVVQRFIVALQDQDYETAHNYLNADLRERCRVDDIRMSTRWISEQRGERRIALVDRQSLPRDRVQVRVRISDINVSPPFQVSEYSHEERYILAQEEGLWRLEEPGWPLSWCPRFERPTPAATPATGQ